jgi:catechol 2,3-dioxygenase-like lactoylglutathione lyase family enzyme
VTEIRNIVETSAYVDDLEAAERFYHEVLELEVIDREANRHLFFRVGNADVLLLFNADETLKGLTLPPHGARGPGHFAFGIAADALDHWRQRLTENGVAIEHEMAWPRGGHSLYFRDPAGNSVELITPGLWGLRSGW